MSDKSSIEWTDATWNPLRGTKGRHHCVRISEGCKNCYAAAMNHRFKGPDYVVGADTPRLDEEALLQPLKWKTPRRIFVCSMTDLFMDEHTDQMIAAVFAVMSIAKQHTFQVLTKRSLAMKCLVSNPMFKLYVNVWRMRLGVAVLPDSKRADGTYAWPLPNVWLGVSAENQERADERIPDLLATPAAVRFVSAEPLLGPVNIERYLKRWLRGDLNTDGAEILEDRNGADWIIVGGESGHGARPFNLQWARDIRRQCESAGTVFFFKQAGSLPFDGYYSKWAGTEPQELDDPCKYIGPLKDKKGGDLSELPAELRVREMPADKGDSGK